MKHTTQWIGALLCLALLTISNLRADEAEDRAVKAVEKLGGKITRDDTAEGRPVVSVDFAANGLVTDAGLKGLQGLKKLRELNLSSTKVSDEGLKELKEFKDLRQLILDGTRVTDAGVADLQEALPKLNISR